MCTRRRFADAVYPIKHSKVVVVALDLERPRRQAF